MVNSVAQALSTGEQRGKLSPLGRTAVLHLREGIPHAKQRADTGRL